MKINNRLLRAAITSLSIITLAACSSSSSDNDVDTGADADNPSADIALFDEATDGDIVNDPNNPQPLQLAVGEGRVSGSVGAGDLDYLTINVPAGNELTAITLANYSAPEGVSFIGVQAGSVFTLLPQDAQGNEDQLLGFVLFGSEMVGEDILADIGTGDGAQGFTPGLAAGDYTFWIQETGDAAVDYSIVFEVEPASDASATDGVLFDETTDGDITNEAASPQPLQLAEGEGRVSGSVGAGDLDYITINVPEGNQLTAITLADYSAPEGVSFIGVQTGSVFTLLPEDAQGNQDQLLGFVLFGSAMVGNDILTDIGTGEGTQGFTPGLAAGDYTFWIQDTGPVEIDYSLVFVVEPATDNAQAGAVLFDEAIDGDIVDDPNNPLPLQFVVGENRINGSMGAPDLEYVTVNVPAGSALTAIELADYTSTDDRSFMAIQSGSVFTEAADSAEVANLLGYVHFGIDRVGEDILEEMSVGAGAQGFTAPLEAGNYTFWIQEIGPTEVGYGIIFVVEPMQ